MIIIESIESLKCHLRSLLYFQQLIDMLLTAASFYAFTDLRAIKIPVRALNTDIHDSHRRVNAKLVVDIIIDTI